ncbi:uncharacterized protein C8R40DRAFT_1172895 [Lentinula edodes]|uniref:uncharacterized protein n=1 Tax=Lentinula edodes TaxID=5353 RepID=UPI001E8E4649|nr:uncharacterized protein C8R40DRAFT_1172895 [Lentinula edodes]KAH7873265.1 hypothetical protein C8R40DRAFT_1172895 [Lentinula edodes]
MPSRPPPPYSEHSPSHPMSTSSLSEALNIPPPPSYSRDMVFRVLKDQKYAQAWMIRVYEHDPAVRVSSFDMTFFTRTLSYKCKSPETRNARNSAICIAPDPYKKRAEVIIKVLQQFDRSALSEVGALKRFSYLFDSGLLKGKPTIITRKFPGVPLQQTDAWIKNPGQRENLREQVRTKVRTQVLLWALGDKLLYMQVADVYYEFKYTHPPDQ